MCLLWSETFKVLIFSIQLHIFNEFDVKTTRHKDPFNTINEISFSNSFIIKTNYFQIYGYLQGFTIKARSIRDGCVVTLNSVISLSPQFLELFGLVVQRLLVESLLSLHSLTINEFSVCLSVSHRIAIGRRAVTWPTTGARFELDWRAEANAVCEARGAEPAIRFRPRSRHQTAPSTRHPPASGISLKM